MNHSDTAQERHLDLSLKGWNSPRRDLIEPIVEKVNECRGASYGPNYDTVSMVLGALEEVEGR